MNSFFEKLENHGGLPALADDEQEISFVEFIHGVEKRKKELSRITANGNLVLWKAKPEIKNIIDFFALARLEKIIVPYSDKFHPSFKCFSSNKQVILSDDLILCKIPENVYTINLRELKTPGLIIASSGTSGEPKLVVHNLGALLEKYLKLKRRFISVMAYRLEHISGIETLLSVLTPGGKIVLTSQAGPELIPSLIIKHKADLLSCTPTFLKLTLLQNENIQWAAGLRKINLSGEPCSLAWMNKFVDTFFQAEINNAFGTTESSIHRTETSPDKSGFKPGKNGEDYKVVDGILFLRNKYKMLGYWQDNELQEGEWLQTQDRVEELPDGFLKIISNETRGVINVGGRKVYLSEVEKVIVQVEGVFDAFLVGEPNPLFGQILKAVIVSKASNNSELKRKILAHCKLHLPDYLIPVKFEFVDNIPHTLRYKSAVK